MKLFGKYIRSRMKMIFAFMFFAAILIFSFFLYGLPARAVLYPVAICILFGCAFLICGFIKTKKKHGIIMSVQKNTNTFVCELPDADTIAEEDYSELIKSLEKLLEETKSHETAKCQNLSDYYTVWVHQIKTPIASAKLILQNEDSDRARRLSLELLRIEQYAQMVLTYLRIDSDNSDYMIKEYELDGIVKGAVKKFAPEFIMRRLRLEYEPIEKRVITDEKWLMFVIEQIISNALKYTKEGKISVYMKDSDTLAISDTGMGIASEDIPRIFEKGYTGYNGRKDMTASGMGLYLCKRVCKNLGYDINAESEAGKGTTVLIRMKQQKSTYD